MAIRGTFQVKGVEEVMEKLRQKGVDLDAAAADAVLAAGNSLLTDMQALVPVDTGNLRDKLRVAGPNRDGNYVFATIGLSSQVDAETARYGTVQEYGSAHTPAQPYIRPALDNGKTRARRAMIAALKAGLE